MRDILSYFQCALWELSHWWDIDCFCRNSASRKSNGQTTKFSTSTVTTSLADSDSSSRRSSTQSNKSVKRTSNSLLEQAKQKELSRANTNITSGRFREMVSGKGKVWCNDHSEHTCTHELARAHWRESILCLGSAAYLRCTIEVTLKHRAPALMK